MIKTTHTHISKATLQRVGQKVNQDLNHLCTEEFPLTENEEDLLRAFFINSIKSNLDILKFCHHISLEYNTMYSNTKQFFNQEISFIEYSNNVLHHLYEKSNHPQIKSGELFVVLFKDIQFQEITTDAIGIFKIEKKVDYLNFNHADDDLDFSISKGVKLQKVDKGCIILNSEEADGFRAFSIDNNSYDTNYWKKAFLNLEEILNDSFQTKHHINLLTGFSNTLVDNNDTYKQKEFMSTGLKLFQENESITKDMLHEELLEPFDVVEPYSDFKNLYNKEHNLQLEDNFNVASHTLKKEKRKIKNQINLDTKIQIKLDLSDAEAVKENLERGFDEERKMYYYKVFYNEET